MQYMQTVAVLNSYRPPEGSTFQLLYDANREE